MANGNSIKKATPGFSLQNKDFSRVMLLHFLGALLVLCLFFGQTAHADEALPDSEIRSLYSQGTELFHQATAISESDPPAARGLYKKAILRFERLVDEGGVMNGKLFYNIGNIYFLVDDMGRAILNYRRAENLMPNDPNLAKNLAYARSMRLDRLEVEDQEKILQTLFFFHYDLKPATRLVVFAIFYLAFWLFAGIKIFSKRPYTTWGLSVTLIFALLFGGSLFVEARQAGKDMSGVILAVEVIGRQGDADSYQPSFEDPLHNGTEFTLLEDRNAWWHVELPDGRSTWIPATDAELVNKK